MSAAAEGGDGFTAAASEGFPGRIAVLRAHGGDGRGRRHRSAEHEHGRAAARAALGLLGGPGLERVPIGADADGCPVWPAGVAGSISHSAPWAAAAAAWTRSGVRGVGVDVEVVRPRHAALWERVVMPDDAQAAPPGAPAEYVATVCFALREAVYKCVFPVLRVPMDWPDARLATNWDVGSAGVVLGERLGCDGALAAEFRAHDGAVVALCWWTAGASRK
ncbi:4'-phosphopantetheinyl transferase superfamily protein [Sinomonas sp. ASV486]|uniref:4'-phosphopantetheinyl transferase superfamily protein n=1 Tax=Sinomonas sp. ASV486 TaxID=3051170 RepID=UPI0027DC867F|nr:4'-phosphopantetheinyl transferase superfamily protein [Sinomonas sp. ASV486]MDQ4492195.1 4'-phosphopantetheinyl transferase superfamily protein [Sinomonas sp. ASV486]